MLSRRIVGGVVFLLLFAFTVSTFARESKPVISDGVWMAINIAVIGLVTLILLIALVLVASLLSWAGFTRWPVIRNTQHFLQIFGICVTMGCTLIAIGGMTDIFIIEQNKLNVLWGSVVAGIVLSVQTWFRNALRSKKKDITTKDAGGR